MTPTTGNYQYDNAGNLVKGPDANGVLRRYEYDAAGRLVKIKDDANPSNVLETYTYGADRKRLMMGEPAGGGRVYVWGGNSVIGEFYTNSGAVYWDKSYFHAGSWLVATSTYYPYDKIDYYHPDRLGSKPVTDPYANTSYEQSTLPFGTALNAESTGYSNQTFTSYDRSSSTGLDYAVNRTYSSGQERFKQVDPLGMGAASADPQSLNLYAYTQNSPIDFVDPSGLNMMVCQEWHIVYDGGPHDGEEVPGSPHWTVCHSEGGGGSGGEGASGGGGGITDGVKPVLDKKDCRAFLNKVLTEMGAKQDIDSLFASLKNNIGFNPDLAKRKTKDGDVHGESSFGIKGERIIDVLPYSPKGNPTTPFDTMTYYATIIIHELLHQANPQAKTLFGHDDMRDAMEKVGGVKKPKGMSDSTFVQQQTNAHCS